MEDKNSIKLTISYILGGTLLVLPFFVLAYDDKTTHPALTQEIVKLFNQHYPALKLNEEEKELVIQGSIDEDKGTRWMQHFYDPVYNRGLILAKEWMSAKEWAQNTKAQAGIIDRAFAGNIKSYFSGEEDYSWNRAIYEYAWADKKRGLFSLGHVLHLLEDTTVPDHTRNDPHPPILEMGSPYEAWTKKFTRYNYQIKRESQPIFLMNLNNYFDDLAIYSNNNFFSEDKIFSEEYQKPTPDFIRSEQVKQNIFLKYGYKTINEQTYKLVLYKPNFAWKNFDPDKKYTIDDEGVLTDYWSLLSEQAVIHGAGAIKLFFDEVEREKQTKTLYNKNKSWIRKQVDKVMNLASTLFSGIPKAPKEEISKENTDFAALNEASKKTEENFNISENLKISKTADENLDIPESDISEQATEIKPPIPIETKKPETNGAGLPESKQPKSSNTSSSLPIAGVGGSPPPENPSTASTGSNNIQPESPPPQPPPPPPVPPTPPETPPQPPPEDTDPPNISLIISECQGNQSLSPDECLIATTTIKIEWSSDADDLAYYTIGCNSSNQNCANFNIGTTTATSTIYTVANGTYTFAASAKDTNGNTSSTTSKTIEINTIPIVINEIAWGGTSSNRAQDEWIEIFNPTDKTINLDQIKLKSLTDEKPNINLSGNLPPKSYYIIERTDDNTISDITASTTASFGGGSGSGLANTGEILALIYKNTILDQTPMLNECGGWCGGVAAGGQYYSMERYDPLLSGGDKNNWGTWPGFLARGKNADNLAIQGTPGRRNSLNHLISKIGVIAQNQTITKLNSPYFIPSDLTILNGATLTINPGVVIKFPTGTFSSLIVNGKLKAEGTEEENIIFTSFKDDSYGGDTNQDGSESKPQNGDWASLKILSDDSIINHSIIRYGGKKDLPQAKYWANIRIENSSTTISNSIIENSGVYGLWLKNASGTIAHNIIQKNSQTEGAGIVIEGGAPNILNNSIKENQTGILAELQAVPIISNNNFKQNSNKTMLVSNAYPVFSNNTAISNAINGIEIAGSIGQNYTLNSNLPFVINDINFTILNGNTLDIAEGTIIKLLGGIVVNGKLNANGSISQKVVFTSFNDDEYGGDTNATTTQPQAGDWRNISFNLGSASSTLKHTIIRYGGPKSIFLPQGALRINNTSINIENTTIEKNYFAGIFMTTSTSTKITNSSIQNHKDDTLKSHYGLFLTSSSTPILQNTTFQNNKTHISFDQTSTTTDAGGNVFD